MAVALRSVIRLVLCVALCLAVGALGSVVTRPEIPGWYATLAKPFWTPPPVAFPIAWTTLYLLMAVALWRLWDRVPPSVLRTRAMALFALQLALNAVWSPVFFKWHNPAAALVVIGLLVPAIAMLIATSARLDRIAAWLLAPYLAWVVFATTINGAVVAMN